MILVIERLVSGVHTHGYSARRVVHDRLVDDLRCLSMECGKVERVQVDWRWFALNYNLAGLPRICQPTLDYDWLRLGGLGSELLHDDFTRLLHHFARYGDHLLGNGRRRLWRSLSYDYGRRIGGRFRLLTNEQRWSRG